MPKLIHNKFYELATLHHQQIREELFNMSNILITDKNASFTNLLKAELETTSIFDEVLVATSIIEIDHLIQSYTFDLLIYNLEFGLDYINLHKTSFKHIVVTTNHEITESTKQELKYLDVHFCFEKPLYISYLKNVLGVISALRNDKFSIINSHSLSYEDIQFEMEITNLLKQMGFPTHFKSYTYLVRGLRELYRNPSIINNLHEGFYRKLEAEYHLKPGAVERSIRHGIATSFTRGNPEFIEDIFGYIISKDKGIPTNKEFFTAVLSYVKLTTKSKIIA